MCRKLVVFLTSPQYFPNQSDVKFATFLATNGKLIKNEIWLIPLFAGVKYFVCSNYDRPIK